MSIEIFVKYSLLFYKKSNKLHILLLVFRHPKGEIGYKYSLSASRKKQLRRLTRSPYKRATAISTVHNPDGQR